MCGFLWKSGTPKNPLVYHFPCSKLPFECWKKNIFRRATKQPEFPDVVGQYPEDGRGAFDEIHLSWWATLAVAKSPECIRMRVFDPRWFYCETLQFGGLLDLGEPNGDPKWLNAGTYESWQLMETTRHTDTKSYIMSSHQPVLISRRCKTPWSEAHGRARWVTPNDPSVKKHVGSLVAGLPSINHRYPKKIAKSCTTMVKIRNLPSCLRSLWKMAHV